MKNHFMSAQEVSHGISPPVNPVSIDATEQFRFDHSTISVTEIDSIRDFVTHLKPFGKPLNDHLIAQVSWDAITFVIRHHREGSIVERAKAASRTIAIRAQARELRHADSVVHDFDLDLVAAPHGQEEYDRVEVEMLLDAVSVRLAEEGIARERTTLVVLSLLGWRMSDIASLLNQKTESVRKRISRARPFVLAELRRQFQEVPA